MMKIAVVLLSLAVLSCVGPIKEDLERNRILGNTLSVESLPEEKKRTIYITADEGGFNPDTVEAKQNDYVRLVITNKYDRDISTFYIEGYHIAEYYSYSETIVIPFVAHNIGTFNFGDNSPLRRKGTLVIAAER